MVGVGLVAGAALTRERAREDARRELSERVYQEERPGPIDRAVTWLLEQVSELLSRLDAVAPGGPAALVALAALLVLLVVGVRLYIGPLARGRSGPVGLDVGRPRSAAEHRTEAERLASAGRYPEAVRERLRAVVRELEARGVLDPRPGRTAAELAAEAGAAVPAIGADLRTATGVFDEVWYGGRTAGAEDYAVVRAVDDRVRVARLAVTAGVSGAP